MAFGINPRSSQIYSYVMWQESVNHVIIRSPSVSNVAFNKHTLAYYIYAYIRCGNTEIDCE